MKFKINSKFNIKIHSQYKSMIFTGFRDTDLKKIKKIKKNKKKKKKKKKKKL